MNRFPRRPRQRGASQAEVLAVAFESAAALRRSAMLQPFKGSLLDDATFDVCWRAVPTSWRARAWEMAAFACQCLGHDGPVPEPLFYEPIRNDDPWGFAAYGSSEIALSIDVPRGHQPCTVGHEVFHTLDPLRHDREERAAKAGEAIGAAWWNFNAGT